MKLFDTASQQLKAVPTDHPITLYSCGPTVYNPSTLGNWRTFIINDLLYRSLTAAGLSVNWGLNYTDVGHLTSDADSGEDKLQRQAKLEQTKSAEIADRNIALFEKQMQSLHITKPQHVLRATAVVPEMIAFIKQLAELGYTYQTSDGVYFDTAKFNDYGKLAHLNLAGQQTGTRVAENPEKKQPADFALWKFSLSNQHRDMEWDSPWGVGFPGWHIECTTMVHQLFGDTVDIHTGGIDLLQTHHQNELAQSEAVTGKPLAHIWLHVEHLLVDGKRMGKSEGNAFTLVDLAERGFNPLDFRYLVLMTNYRQKQNFTWEALQAAKQARAKLLAKATTKTKTTSDSKILNELISLVGHDLDFPAALARLHSYIKKGAPELSATIVEADRLLFGILPAISNNDLQTGPIPARVKELLIERDQARAKGDYQKADQCRQLVNEAGYSIVDQPGGSTLVKNDQK